jgi:hypothetical protein
VLEAGNRLNKENRRRGKHLEKNETSALFYGLKSNLFPRKCKRNSNVENCQSFQAHIGSVSICHGKERLKLKNSLSYY